MNVEATTYSGEEKGSHGVTPSICRIIDFEDRSSVEYNEDFGSKRLVILVLIITFLVNFVIIWSWDFRVEPCYIHVFCLCDFGCFDFLFLGYNF